MLMEESKWRPAHGWGECHKTAIEQDLPAPRGQFHGVEETAREINSDVLYPLDRGFR